MSIPLMCKKYLFKSKTADLGSMRSNCRILNQTYSKYDCILLKA